MPNAAPRIDRHREVEDVPAQHEGRKSFAHASIRTLRPCQRCGAACSAGVARGRTVPREALRGASVAARVAGRARARRGAAAPRRPSPPRTRSSASGSGADRQLADWTQIVDYFQPPRRGVAARAGATRSAAPPRAGPSCVVTITSEANMARLEEIRRDNLRLADPRGLCRTPRPSALIATRQDDRRPEPRHPLQRGGGPRRRRWRPPTRWPPARTRRRARSSTARWC